MQNVVLGAYALKLTGSSAFVGLVFFAQLGPLLFLSTLGGLLADVVDRRRFLVGAARAARALVRARGDRPLGPSVARADRGRGVRDRHRQRARRARPQRDPPDAGPARGPAGRGRAGVGADEPLACHRADHRRRDLLRAERGAGVRDQRAHLPVRGDRAAVGQVPAPHARERRGARVRPPPLGGAHRAAGSADLAHPPDALLVLVLLARVRRPHAGDRRAELRHRAEELAVRRALRVLRPRRRARRGERRHGVRAGVEGEAAAPGVPRVRGVLARLRRCCAVAFAIPVRCSSATRTSSRSPRCRHSSNRTSSTKNEGG